MSNYRTYRNHLEYEYQPRDRNASFKKCFQALSVVSILFLMPLMLNSGAKAFNQQVRIKDIVYVEGVRKNLLVGYGLVVGLNGTGDNLNNSVFTQKGLTDFLQRLGINTKGSNLKTKNVAAVTVTATLPAFARHGSYIDVQVSTLGDAKSLDGGTLLATPLLGADGEVYAVAQGQVALGGFKAADASSTVATKNVPTNGSVAGGAVIEKEIDFTLNDMARLNLALRNPDISTAERISQAINKKLKMKAASAKDPGTVELAVPETYKGQVVQLLNTIEQLRVEPDQIARIVVNENSGTIVMGENVQVSNVAIAQGNLMVQVETKDQEAAAATPANANANAPVQAQPVSAPAPEPRGSKIAMLPQGNTLKDLVDGLNALGVGPRDLINILQTIKASGALQAEIEVK